VWGRPAYASTYVTKIMMRAAPEAAKARAIIADLEVLKQQHGPLVTNLSTRRFEGIPTGGLNLVARIEALCRDIQGLWQQPVEDLNRLVREVERLRPETAALFCTHTEAFHFYLAQYPHTPAAIAEAIKTLIHTLELLTQRLDMDEVEPTTTVHRPPPAASLTPEVEMA
jgi:hypothetical protein